VDPTGLYLFLIGAGLAALYTGYQFYKFGDKANKAFENAKQTRELNQECQKAILESSNNADFICKMAEGTTLDHLGEVGNLVKEGAFSPGTFGRGPIPTNIGGCISNEIQAELRDMNGTK